MTIRTIDFDFAHHWKFDLELINYELFDALGIPRLLCHELVARESQYLQPSVAVVAIHL